MSDKKANTVKSDSISIPPHAVLHRKGVTADENDYFGKFILMMFLTACVVILFSSMISSTRQEKFRMAGTKVLLEKQTARLQAETNRLEDEFTALKGDTGRVEKEARERFGYLGADEIIYPLYNFSVKNMAKREPVTLSFKNRWKAFLFDGPFPWQFPALIILISSAYYLISYHYEYRKLHQSGC